MPSFPSGASAPLPTAISRTIGGIQLNDRVNTFWDRCDRPGTHVVQAEQLISRGGDVAIVKTDWKGIVLTVYLIWKDGAGRILEDFYWQLENLSGVPFVFEDGKTYPSCYVQDIVATQVGIAAQEGDANPWRRVYKVSFKVVSTKVWRV